MDDEQEYNDYENDDESWDDDSYYIDDSPELELEEEPADVWDGVSEPQEEQFETYADYDNARVYSTQ